MGRVRVVFGVVLIVVGVVGLLEVDAATAGDDTIDVVVRTGHLHEDDVPDVQRPAVRSVSCVVERPGEEPLTIESIGGATAGRPVLARW